MERFKVAKLGSTVFTLGAIPVIRLRSPTAEIARSRVMPEVASGESAACSQTLAASSKS